MRTRAKRRERGGVKVFQLNCPGRMHNNCITHTPGRPGRLQRLRCCLRFLCCCCCSIAVYSAVKRNQRESLRAVANHVCLCKLINQLRSNSKKRDTSRIRFGYYGYYSCKTLGPGRDLTLEIFTIFFYIISDSARFTYHLSVLFVD